MVSIDFVSDSQQMKLYDYVEQNTMSHIGFRIRGIQLPNAVLPRVVKNSLVAMINYGRSQCCRVDDAEPVVLGF